MGKAKITENKGAGLYSVELLLKDGDGETVDAWCADYTDDIEVGATVGTIEIDGVGVSLVKPGFDDPSWSASDGILADPTKATPSGFFWNSALLPAWQKFKPTAREGTIISIDAESGTASVCLKPATGPLGVPLEPDDLLECSEYEEEPEPDDPNMEQLADFCERHPDHPACQPVIERTTISYDTWWQTIVDINTQVNTNVTYARDVGGDVWDIATSGTGDCEDYALGKMQLMADAGIPASAMGIAVGKIGSGPVRGPQDADHAWAVVFTDKGMFHLEQAPNIPKQTRPAQNTRILRYQQPYEILARRLDDVPIEYMDCDGDAFEEGDGVLVVFEGQEWGSPKIVGFVSHPPACYREHVLLKFGDMVSVWCPECAEVVLPPSKIGSEAEQAWRERVVNQLPSSAAYSTISAYVPQPLLSAPDYYDDSRAGHGMSEPLELCDKDSCFRAYHGETELPAINLEWSTPFFEHGPPYEECDEGNTLHESYERAARWEWDYKNLGPYLLYYSGLPAHYDGIAADARMVEAHGEIIHSTRVHQFLEENYYYPCTGEVLHRNRRTHVWEFTSFGGHSVAGEYLATRSYAGETSIAFDYANRKVYFALRTENGVYQCCHFEYGHIDNGVMGEVNIFVSATSDFERGKGSDISAHDREHNAAFSEAVAGLWASFRADIGMEYNGLVNISEYLSTFDIQIYRCEPEPPEEPE